MGAGMSVRSRASLHPQIDPSEQAAGVPVGPDSLPFNDDLLREILIRLPPQPSALPRASAVCRLWRRLVAGPKFQRQFRVHHRKPPLLGVFKDSGIKGVAFTPVLDPPDRIPPRRFDLGRYSDRRRCVLLDCRHGRVLVQDQMKNELVVCDPVTGEQRRVAVPSEFFKRGCLEGLLLCTAGDHGHGCQTCSYKVVLVSTARSDNLWLACVYSLETGTWGNHISTKAPHKLFNLHDVVAALVGNCLYWATGIHMLEFDLDTQNLAVIMGPLVMNGGFNGNRQIVQAADGAVVHAGLTYPRLEMWKRDINGHGVTTWVPWKSIEMGTTLGLFCPVEQAYVQLLWCDEDDVLLCHDESLYIVQLKSMQCKKLDVIYSAGNRYFALKSFFTPGEGLVAAFLAESSALHKCDRQCCVT